MPTRGPQAGPVIFNHTGLIGMIKTINALIDRLSDVDASPAVRAAGKAWQKNFETQGSMVGGWKALSEYTQRLREYRGFSPSYPVLRQSGNLKTLAADVPASFKGKSMNRTVSAGYTGSDQTNLFIVNARGRATLVLRGDKVTNNFGGTTTGHGWQTTEEHRVPRRRFWFLNEAIIEEATKGIFEQFKPELDKLS